MTIWVSGLADCCHKPDTGFEHRRKWVQARSKSNTIWLSFRGNMASDQTVSQKQGRGSISGTSMRAETCVHKHARTHTRTHARRHWIKMWTHTVSRICVALCVLAKPMKQNHSGRNVHFAQKELDFSNSHTGCEISGEILSSDKWTHFVSPSGATWAVQRIVMRVIFLHWYQEACRYSSSKTQLKMYFDLGFSFINGGGHPCVFLSTNTDSVITVSLVNCLSFPQIILRHF